MEWFFGIITSKAFAAIALTSVILYELRTGFLKEFKNYLKTVSWILILKIWLAAAILAFLLFTIDQPLLNRIQGAGDRVAEVISFGVFWGRAASVWGSFAAIYWISKLFKKTFINRLFFAALVSSSLTSLVVHIVKYVFARARPLVEIGPGHFFKYQDLWGDGGSRYLSFSSGDVAIAAGAMSLFFIAIKSPLRYLFLIPSFLTCLSRIYLDKHWPSDTAFSYVISFSLAIFVWGYSEFRKKA